MAKDIGGHWITINGAHIFIKDGQTVNEAFHNTTGKNLVEKEHPLKDYRNPSAEEVKKVARDANWQGGYSGEQGIRYKVMDSIESFATYMEDNGLSFKEMLKSDRALYKDAKAKLKKNPNDRDAKETVEIFNRAEAIYAKHFLKNKTSADVVKDYKSTKKYTSRELADLMHLV